MQAILDQKGEDKEVILPGRNKIPEFVAMEFVVLNSELQHNPSQVAEAVKDILRYERLCDGKVNSTEADKFIANYLKWLFQVMQVEGDSTIYPSMSIG